MRRIDPFTDTGFKVLFGKENQSEPLLKDFLNDIFMGQSGFEHIKSLSYHPGEKIRNRIDDKGIIYDIHCETDSGHKFIVEMQKARQDFFLKRAIYYVSSAIADQGHKGSGNDDWEFDFKPVAVIFICDFNVKFLPKKLVTHVHLADMEDGKTIGNYMHYVFIQSNLFNKEEDQCETGFDIWMYILKNLKNMGEIPFKTRKDEVYERLDRLSQYTAMTAEEQVEYERDLKWARDYKATLKTARREGFAEGEEKGLKVGMEKGKQAGLAEGLWSVATNLFYSGMSIEDIAKNTGLSIDDLKATLK